MDILAIISTITTIASLLSLFFDITDKIAITARRFILIVSVVFLVYYGINWAVTHSKNDLPNTNNITNGQNYNEDIMETPMPSSSTSTTSTNPDLFEHDSATNSTEGFESFNEKLLQIEPVMPSPLDIASIVDSEYTVPPTDIMSFSDTFFTKEQCIEYEINPQFDGKHRFEFSDVPDGVDFCLYITNAGGETIKSDYNLDNGDGITLTLLEKNRYYAKIEPYRNIGKFTLNVGNKKPCVDASQFTKVFDSIQYTGQQNDYSFVPTVSGKYRFEFSDVPDGTDLQLYVYNSGWEVIKSDYDLDNADGITVSLVAQQTYYIRVEQFENIGSYTLNIGHKKDIADISSYTTVSDSIQYTNQQNDYSFVPTVSGKYRFEFSDVPDGTDLQLYIYNSGWEIIKSDYDLDNADGITVSLIAQQTYYIRVEQFEGIGSYSLNVGHKKDIADISSYTMVSDSIQYTNQQNDYSFVPTVSGKYRFEFSDVPDGTDLQLYIYNSGWETIKSDYDLDNGDGITASLDANHKYFICVSHYNQYGHYVINVLNVE